MKIGVCTLAIGDVFKKSTYFGNLTKIDYCKKYNYEFLNDEGEDIYDFSRPIPWSKVRILQKYLDQYDYLVWLDGDTIIMNDEVSLENLITTHMGDKDFMLCTDNGLILNTGVWFVKNSPYAKTVLETMYNRVDLINARFWEQAAFIDMYNNNTEGLPSHCVVFPVHMQNLFNCAMYNYHDGDFLIHFLGFCGNPEFLGVVMKKFYPKRHEVTGETEEQFAARMKNIAENPGSHQNAICPGL